jgi:PAS domain S-box-containing protein
MAIFGFCGALAILAAMSTWSYLSLRGFVERANWVEHSQQVLRETEAVLSDLKDVEAGVRGYLMSDKESFLVPYVDGLARIPVHLSRLREITVDNADQQKRVLDLERLVDRRLRQAALFLSTASANRPLLLELARTHLATGKLTMDEIRDVVNAMEAHEEKLLVQRTVDSKRSATMTIAILVAGTPTSFTMLVIAFMLLQKEIGRRARAERAAQASAAETASLYNEAPCGYHSEDKNGIFLRINDTELAWLGYNRDEVVGKLKFIDVVAPECRQTVLDNFPRLLQGDRITDLEYTLVRKDGSTFPVALNAAAQLDEEGTFVMSRTTMFDISALRAARSKLEAANKELESFSYSVSHDLRAPLRAIDGFTNIFVEDYGGQIDDEGRRLLTVIRENSQRMGLLIDNLLAFSRMGRQPLSTKSVNMKSLALEALGQVKAEGIGTNASTVIHDLPAANADPALLKQVWINLLSNALKYSSARTAPRVEVGALTHGATSGHATFFVKDNGVGFDMRYYDKLFGVFQRLHSAEEFSGTGVGLAIVQRLITRHGGKVWAEAELDKGATFFFSLPLGGQDDRA